MRCGPAGAPRISWRDGQAPPNCLLLPCFRDASTESRREAGEWCVRQRIVICGRSASAVRLRALLERLLRCALRMLARAPLGHGSVPPSVLRGLRRDRTVRTLERGCPRDSDMCVVVRMQFTFPYFLRLSARMCAAGAEAGPGARGRAAPVSADRRADVLTPRLWVNVWPERNPKTHRESNAYAGRKYVRRIPRAIWGFCLSVTIFDDLVPISQTRFPFLEVGTPHSPCTVAA